MPAMSRDIDVVPNPHFNHLTILEGERSSSLQHHHPLMFLLVIPTRFRRGMPLGENTLNPYITMLHQCLKNLLPNLERNCRKEITDHPFNSMKPA